ncbi:MAG: type II toxin-antitoxin system RelE/ParE family toxin [Candidatus Pacebacteria bacterium]|jgi:mRNA-degrading endonuclease RelE of RelBE toxin-antitoxin system|nr:type II toxin-antitoxin system RelE/ParE family toxin [Candidatus Paceibacterota bacterium]
MAYQLRLKPSAEKELNKLPQKDYCRALAAFSVIANDPYAGKKLEGKRAGQYSMRIWPYRIIYSIYKKELLIIVISIGHRQGIY